MKDDSTSKIIFPSKYADTAVIIKQMKISSSSVEKPQYNHLQIDDTLNHSTFIMSTIEKVSQWFLSMSAMSNKKLQKLCYYAYCWFIVFFNDAEQITIENTNEINVLCSDRFEAWIHGPVSPGLYHYYKKYGWHDIPQVAIKQIFPSELEELLRQVWNAYGSFSADELEAISHNEAPWINARRGLSSGEACSNEISNYDILQYYSKLN